MARRQHERASGEAVSFCFHFCFVYLIGVQLLYNVVLVSAVQRSESALCIHISPPAWTSFLPTNPLHHPAPLDHQGAELPVLCSRFPRSVLHKVVYICQSQSPISSPPLFLVPLVHMSVPLFLPCQQVHLLHFSGEGDGTPLQYSCLENPLDGRAWWAAVHGVAEGRTQLNDFPFTFHFHALEKEMATHSSDLAQRIPGTTEPVGCRLWGRTESNTTEATQQQQQYHISRFHISALICDVSLFLTYFTLYDSLQIHPHLYKWHSSVPLYG